MLWEKGGSVGGRYLGRCVPVDDPWSVTDEENGSDEEEGCMRSGLGMVNGCAFYEGNVGD